MAKTSKNLGLMLATLILILACATPATPPPAGFVETAIAGTYSVAASQTAQVQADMASSAPLPEPGGPALLFIAGVGLLKRHRRVA